MPAKGPPARSGLADLGWLRSLSKYMQPTVPPNLQGLSMVDLLALHRSLQASLESMANSMLLTLPQLELMLVVMASPNGSSQRALARALRVQQPTMSTAITRLVERGLLERDEAMDKRSWTIRLAKTEKAREIIASLRRHSTSFDGRYAKSELETTKAMIRRLTRDLAPLGS